MVQPIQCVNVDVTPAMLDEHDKAAQDLNVSRQGVIKTLVRQALDQHYLAQRARRTESSSSSTRTIGREYIAPSIGGRYNPTL